MSESGVAVAAPALELAVVGVEPEPLARRRRCSASSCGVARRERPRGLHGRAHRRRSRSTPAGARYDDGDARAARRSLRRRRSAGRRPRRARSSARVESLVPSFTGARRVRAPRCRAAPTSRSPATRYLDALRDGDGAAQLPLQRVDLLPRRRTAGCRSRWCRGAAPPRYRLPLATWQALIERHYAGGGFVRLQAETRSSCSAARRAELGLPTFDAAISGRARMSRPRRARRPRCSTRATRSTRTRPGATKNATPTPFGIVYPPAYAAGNGATFDHLRLECRWPRRATASTAEVRFLQSSGERHRAVERRVGARRARACGRSRFDGARGRARLRARRRRASACCVHNRTDVPRGPRPRARRSSRSLISTQALVRAAGGRFLSPLEARLRERQHVAGARDATPTTSCSAPRSSCPTTRGSRPRAAAASSTATEIEEALLLHVHALSDARARGDRGRRPGGARRWSSARAAATPDGDRSRLHGVMRPAEQPPEHAPGEREAVVGGVDRPARRRSSCLRPGAGADAYDLLLDGRTATLERIYVDYDDAVHLGVTVDSDPMQRAAARERPLPLLQARRGGGRRTVERG